jgi:hypothetical protein
MRKNVARQPTLAATFDPIVRSQNFKQIPARTGTARPRQAPVPQRFTALAADKAGLLGVAHLSPLSGTDLAAGSSRQRPAPWRIVQSTELDSRMSGRKRQRNKHVNKISRLAAGAEMRLRGSAAKKDGAAALCAKPFQKPNSDARRLLAAGVALR